MNELQINNQTIDSREIAKMGEVAHKELLKKITKFNEILERAKLRSLDYFIPSTYMVDGNKRNYPCYQFTKMGCEFIANKFTGEKGVIFTAKYVKKFNDMEQSIKMNRIPDFIKLQEIEAKLTNAKVRQANLIRKIADDMSTPKEYKQILNSKAVEILTGQSLLSLPSAERKTYTAEEIGSMVIDPLKGTSISANMVGRIANVINLKTSELGKLVEDKKKYSNGQCQSWRYYEEAVPKIQQYLNNKT